MRRLMRFWSIQTAEMVELLNREGSLVGRPSFDFQQEQVAYCWMAEQMRARGILCEFPIWCWFAYDGKAGHPPDLRCRGHLPRGTRGVRLTLEIDPHRTLLSQFEMWCGVMDGHYIAATLHELRANAQSQSRAALSDESIRRSWERIFDLTCGSPGAWGSLKTRWIQACIDRIDLEDVVNQRAFVAR